MIGIKGSWVINASINDIMIKSEELAYLNQIEESGFTVLPSLDLALLTSDRKLIEACNKNSIIKIMISKDLESDKFFEFIIFSVKTEVLAGKKSSITISAIFNLPKYYYECEIDYFNGTSIEAVTKEFNKLGLSVEVNSNTNDTQSWLKYNLTPQKFIQDLMKVSYKDPNSVFSVGVMSDKTVRVFDLIKSIKSATKVIGYTDNSDYLYTRIHKVNNNYGLLDSLSGAGKYIENYNLVSDGYFKEKAKTTIITTDEIVEFSDLNRFYSSELSIVDNVNSNYFKGLVNQVQKLSKLSTFSIKIDFVDQFIDFKLFDSYVVRFPQDDSKDRFSNESFSGKWIVTKIINSFQDNSLVTSIELVREGINKVK